MPNQAGCWGQWKDISISHGHYSCQLVIWLPWCHCRNCLANFWAGLVSVFVSAQISSSGLSYQEDMVWGGSAIATVNRQWCVQVRAPSSWLLSRDKGEEAAMTERWLLCGAVSIRVPAHLTTKEIIDKVFAFLGAKQKPLLMPFWHIDLTVPVAWQPVSKYLHPSQKDQIGQVTVFSEQKPSLHFLLLTGRKILKQWVYLQVSLAERGGSSWRSWHFMKRTHWTAGHGFLGGAGEELQVRFFFLL